MMFVAVGSVVTRGGKPGENRCDGCRRHRENIRECRIPVGSLRRHDAPVYWYDLGSDCVVHVQHAPFLPPQKAKADQRIDALFLRLRSASLNAGRTRPDAVLVPFGTEDG